MCGSRVGRYKSIAKDENDKVYAIVQDYLVKTLVIEEVENDDAGKDDDVKPGTNALSLSNSGVITVTLAEKTTVDTKRNSFPPGQRYTLHPSS